MEPAIQSSKRYKRSTQFNESITNNKKRLKRGIPHIIYPEILVIVDYDGYRLHGGDNVQVKRYFVSFWNGVDLRYRLLKGPRIRISIAGIIISRVNCSNQIFKLEKVINLNFLRAEMLHHTWKGIGWEEMQLIQQQL